MRVPFCHFDQIQHQIPGSQLQIEKNSSKETFILGTFLAKILFAAPLQNVCSMKIVIKNMIF